MTAQAVPASPLCRAGASASTYLRHDIAPDGVCRRCQMRFGGLRVAVSQPQEDEP